MINSNEYISACINSAVSFGVDSSHIMYFKVNNSLQKVKYLKFSFVICYINKH